MKPTDAPPCPADWHTKSVRDVALIKRGVSWSKDQEFSEQREGTVAVVGISNVQERLELDDLLYLSGLKPKTIEAKRVSAGWSLVVGSNGNRRRIGNAVLIDRDQEFLFASFLIAVAPKPESGITPEFFYRWLSSERVQAYITASAEGTTGLSNLSHSFFRAMQVAYPGPREQAAVARVLDAVDQAIERARDVLARVKELKRAISQRAFSEGVRGEQQQKTSLGFIPKSWMVKPVGEVVNNFEYGLSLAMSLKGQVPILRMGNIQAGNVVLDDLKYVTLPDKVMTRYLLRRGDVLFNRTNSQEHVGKIGIYRSDEPAVFASYLIRLHPLADQVNPYFLGHVLSSYQAQCRIKRYATPGVQQVNINAKNLSKVLIPVPVGPSGMEEQKEIAALLEHAESRIRSYEPVLETLEELKRSLLHDLLTGTVRLDPILFAETPA